MTPALVTGDPHIRFYAGYPLTTPDGERIGSFCVIDREPRQFTEQDRRTLIDLGRLVDKEIAASFAGSSPREEKTPAAR